MLMFGTQELRLSLVCRTAVGNQIVAVQSPSTAVKCLPWKGLVVHVHPPWNEKWVLIWSIPLPIGGRRIHPQKQRSEQERDHHSDHCGGVKFACMHLSLRDPPLPSSHPLTFSGKLLRNTAEACCRLLSMLSIAVDCCRAVELSSCRSLL